MITTTGVNNGQITRIASAAAEKSVKEIWCETCKRVSAEEKIRNVLARLRGADSIAELCH